MNEMQVISADETETETIPLEIVEINKEYSVLLAETVPKNYSSENPPSEDVVQKWLNFCNKVSSLAGSGQGSLKDHLEDLEIKYLFFASSIMRLTNKSESLKSFPIPV